MTVRFAQDSSRNEIPVASQFIHFTTARVGEASRHPR
ncbi:protein of unknown function (plasmid) [Caballeronia sp. S22]